jgi:hypothetical protein
VFTHTIPGPGLPCDAEEEAALAGDVEAGWLVGVAGWLGVAGFAWAAAGSALGLATGAAALTVTSGVIFLMVLAEMPAFDNPSTEEYGRPAMIFFAVAVPTPGRSFNSFSVAVFRSTFAFVSADLVEACAADFDDLVCADACPAEAPAAKTLNANKAALK